MLRYLRLEVSRTMRDSRYVVLALGAPVGFYLLFAALFSGSSVSRGELPSPVELMVAMSTFGAMWGALSATAPRLARDRERGWLNVLRVTPLSPARVLIARICAGLLVSGPAVVVVGITARLAHGVHLTAGQWGFGLLVLWIGTLPFVILGIAIGTLTDSTTAYGITLGLYIALAALGGLWVPPANFPPVLLHVAKALPSYNQADLGWRIAANAVPTGTSVLVLAAWTVALAAIAYLAGTGIRFAPKRNPPPLPPDVRGAAQAAAVQLARLAKNFGSVSALGQLDLEIPRASTVALLGPNGAGKTTAIRIMLGLLRPDQGSARLFGGRPSDAVSRGQVGAMLQDAELMSGVKVGELLRFIRSLYPDPLGYESTVRESGLEQIINRRTDRLSTGQAQRVSFAVALIGNPMLMVLDEPTAGLDVQAQQIFWDDMRAYRASGRTVLFSTHYLEEADQNADRIVVIQDGHVAADGTPQQVRAAGGARMVVRFRWLGPPRDGIDRLPGVTAVECAGANVTLQTTDSDATVWGLYEFRKDIAALEVTGGGLRAAFLALTGAARSS
ncbi:MAG: ATP-binding cassette domain-containing protein [Actinomycetota bacterium]|nr:ATP-binding cassette domain-containing protein [Actinomycetota bacterium]